MQNPTQSAPIDETQAQDGPTPAAVPSEKPITAPGTEKRGAVAKLFDPETRLGRFMRGLTRVLALSVGFFALGVLTAYLLLYRPLAEQSVRDQASLSQLRQQVDQLQKDASQAKADAARLTQANKDLTAQADQAKGRQALLSAELMVSQARFALANKDASSAKSFLSEVPAALDRLAPIAGSANADQIADMRSRLALAQGEMDRDPQTAGSDLGILSAQLADLGKRVFGE